MVGLFEGGAKDGHEFITHILLESSLIGENFLGHFFKVFTEHIDHLMGREAFRIAGKTL